MNDDKMDELLNEAARDYNKPGAVPREEMWAGIARHRAVGRLGGQAVGRRRQRILVWPAIGVAAAALLAVGVMLGRRIERRGMAPVTVAAKRDSIKPAVDSGKSPAQDTVQKALREETNRTNAMARRLAAASPNRPSAESPDRPDAQSPDRPTAQSPGLAFRLVVLRHLAGSEALITSFRSEAKRGEMDAQIAQWSREMLGTTRLLEASAASDDPVMKRLLEDLDLIIAQIAVYAARGTNNPEDLDLIEQSINQRGILPKLRSTMPASASGSTAAHM